jgi:superfamily II DNA or RNA helicase
MNDDERELYRVATEEFFKMKHLFSSTGNARKDRMMEIIQQITLLLNICRHPSTYGNISTPNKYKKVLELCNSHSNERIAIGTRTLKEVKEYTKLLKETNRELFIITGSTNMDKRLEIIEKLRNTTNGILISTQQSLSVSVNIDFVNYILITSNAWNYSTLSQFFFRFIRYTSKEQKEIHIITYKNTIENNLLYLISQKEELTNFMKDEESENILERLGVNYNLVDMLLIKSRDKDGVKIISKGRD